MTSLLADAGFATIAHAASDNPLADGYIVERRGLPFHVHPSATPDEWPLLEAAIADGTMAVVAWSAPEITLEEARAKALVMIDAACAAQIVDGFVSDALGGDHVYPSQQTDQLNLQSSLLASMAPKLPSGWTMPQMCADSDGLWAYRDHSASQIQIVGAAARNAIHAALARKVELTAAIGASSTADEVNAIAWDQPFNTKA